MGGDTYIPGVTDGPSNGDNGTVNVTNKPKLIISNYSLDPEMPQAGQEFAVSLTFYNTNAEKSVRNIKISIGGGEAGAIPSATQTGGSQASAPSGSAGSVFTPVGSSNTFYISRIRPRETDKKTIHLKTAPTLAAQNYSINVSFEYEDLLGNEFTATETIGIPVVQTADILLGDVQINGGESEGTLMMGNPTNVDMDMYNIGKDQLTTYMVTIEGKGFKVNGSPRYFVGNFAPGGADHFSAEIVPQEQEISGNIVITFEDSTGKKHEQKQPFEAKIEGLDEGMAVDPSKLRHDEKTGLLIDDETSQYYDAKTLEPVPAPQGGNFPLLPVGLGVLVILVAAILIHRHRKKKKQEKELNLDA